MKPFHTPAQRRTPQRQHGVSLVEVLVSVVVVSLGLLGAVALQATALRNNQGSYERTQSSILTQGIFDAMRANLSAVTSGGYNTGDWVCTVSVRWDDSRATQGATDQRVTLKAQL
jgi:type IV pilus assembly protein PilV